MVFLRVFICALRVSEVLRVCGFRFWVDGVSSIRIIGCVGVRRERCTHMDSCTH